ncbi:MAG: IS1595 family transposase, partial [Nitrospirota bacterium]|nr:IS1595 family transposase [Nitrospirota bacterium]
KHQGSISHEHLSSYLNEFVFWFNRRTSAHRGKLFLRLTQQAVAVEPDPYAGLIKGVREGRTRKYKGLG